MQPGRTLRQQAWEALARGDIDDARKLLIQSCKEGDVNAFFDLGYAFESGGFGLAKNARSPHYFWREGAERGHYSCMAKHAWVLTLSEKELHFNWREKVLGSDDAFAKGLWYWEKREADFQNALPLLQLASENVYAETILGECYMNGKGREKDDRLAMEYFSRAAEKGFAPAQFMIGSLLQQNQRFDEAFNWLLRSAKQRYSDAQVCVGKCYLNGLGTEKNLALARSWLGASPLLIPYEKADLEHILRRIFCRSLFEKQDCDACDLLKARELIIQLCVDDCPQHIYDLVKKLLQEERKNVFDLLRNPRGGGKLPYLVSFLCSCYDFHQSSFF